MTNMYETVIWVALVAAVLGLVFELIYRRTYAALAGSGVALLGTITGGERAAARPEHQAASSRSCGATTG